MTTESKSTKEIWKPIKGYEGRYEVSTLGRVKSLKRISDQNHLLPERILKACNGKSDYLITGLRKDRKKKSYPVHRLVALTFLPNPENKQQVNHKNGVKHDNRLCNLEWVTPYENTKHALETGLSSSTGEKNNNSKLTKVDVLQIRENKNSLSVTQLSKEFGVGKAQISRIINRQLWQHV